MSTRHEALRDGRRACTQTHVHSAQHSAAQASTLLKVTFQPAVKQAGGCLLRATRVPAGQQVLGDQRQVDHGG